MLSALARSQGGNKKAIVSAGGIPLLIRLLTDEKSVLTQKHAACALWGLSDTLEYAMSIAAQGAIPPLILLLLNNSAETRGFAAACLACLCKEATARNAVLDAGGAEPLLALAHGPATWLRTQAREMLSLLGIPIGEDPGLTLDVGKAKADDPFLSPMGDNASALGTATSRASAKSLVPVYGAASARMSPGAPRMKFHFFSFQIHHVTGYTGW